MSRTVTARAQAPACKTADFPLSYLDFACSTERMRQKTLSNEPRQNPPTVPGTMPGEQRPQHFQDEDEADAFSRWLAHVDAGRIG